MLSLRAAAFASITSLLAVLQSSATEPLVPLKDAVDGGASLGYALLRCAGLYVSVLSLELPPAFAGMKPLLEANLSLAYELSVADRQRETGEIAEIAKARVRDDVATYARKYIETWNATYVATGHYLNEFFDSDASVCRTILR